MNVSRDNVVNEKCIKFTVDAEKARERVRERKKEMTRIKCDGIGFSFPIVNDFTAIKSTHLVRSFTISIGFAALSLQSCISRIVLLSAGMFKFM